LPKELTEEIHGFTGRKGVSDSIVFLAACEILLGRYTRQKNFVIGISSSHRQQQQLANLIGPLENFLPVRAHISGDPTLYELLDKVGQTVAAAERGVSNRQQGS